VLPRSPIRQVENGEKNNCRVSGVRSRKYHDPNDCKNGTKIINACERDGSKNKGFRKAERSDVDKALLKVV
jgi:hypothetical protein